MNKIFTNKHPELGLEINSLKQENNSTSSVEYYILYRPHFLIRRASEEDRKNGKYSFVTSDEGLFLTHKENLRKKLSVIRDEKIDKVL
jgi:hypothetical protein